MLNLQANSVFTANDAKMMARALKLAEKGKQSTTPNPHVGCVIINAQQQIIGEGFHKKAGEGHAEAVALQQTNGMTDGATAYVTLEPCSHHGRTPPCAQAFIDAKIKRVVVACTDPNPQVSGKGIAMLQSAGIEVSLGLMQASALALNKTFFFRMQHKRPFITVKLAASLDGKTALANGESKWITGPLARADVQRHRADVCAILTGADTVIADNPQLNVRLDTLSPSLSERFSWRGRQPLRVVIDSQNRLSAGKYQIFQDGQETLVYNANNNVNLPASQGAKYSQKQVVTVQNEKQSFVDLNALLSDLDIIGINHLWVEAGEKLTGALFDLGFVDQLILYQAPKILGSSARGLTAATAKSSLHQAMIGQVSSVSLLGSDTKTVIEFSH
ncbi:MAG: diaminohydroxyphosphoribosylaminopyrimidine deaminase [Alphaproteobacteria bacterium]|jgi:diaminohydroxyphosphoribosylaminopyrimidine deaminase/5-amino-6-(5-phosphoribosylamino)uracil reductase